MYTLLVVLGGVGLSLLPATSRHLAPKCSRAWALECPYRCHEGYDIITDDYGCKICMCRLGNTTAHCSIHCGVKCYRNRMPRPKRDATGCPTCECCPKDFVCPKCDQKRLETKLGRDGCVESCICPKIEPPTLPTIGVLPSCPPVVCPQGCKEGTTKKVDENGCVTCSCGSAVKMPPCGRLDCPTTCMSGYRKAFKITWACPTCECCPVVTCPAIECPWGFETKIGSDGCVASCTCPTAIKLPSLTD